MHCKLLRKRVFVHNIAEAKLNILCSYRILGVRLEHYPPRQLRYETNIPLLMFSKC